MGTRAPSDIAGNKVGCLLPDCCQLLTSTDMPTHNRTLSRLVRCAGVTTAVVGAAIGLSATSSSARTAGQVLTPSGVAAVVAADTAINNHANGTLSLSLQDSHETCLQATMDDATYRGELATGAKTLGGAFSQVPVRSYVPEESQYPAYFSVLAEDRTPKEPTVNDLLTYVKTSVSSRWKLASSSEILGPTSAGVAVPVAAQNANGYVTSLAPESSDGLKVAPGKVGALIATAFTSEAKSGKLPAGITAEYGKNGAANPHTIKTSYDVAGAVTSTFSTTAPRGVSGPSPSCPYPAIRLANGGALVTFPLYLTISIHVPTGSVVVQPPSRSALGVLLAPGQYTELTLVFGDIGVAVVPKSGSNTPIEVIGQANEGLSETGVAGSGSPSSTAVGAPANAASIAKSVDPGLVDIDTQLKYEGAAAAGTGMVLTANGEVLTNNHVIEDATSITATDVGNGKTYQAEVVGYDRTNDVAVIQLENASGLRTVSIGDSSSLRSGAGVVGVGNAGGDGGTPSYAGGSVTALDQSITASDQSDGTSEDLTGLIATNAGIEPGDSGGPLVTANDKVVGMDTAASAGFEFQAAGASTTQAYAIPINEATTIAGELKAGKSSNTLHVGPTAFLGVAMAPVQSGRGTFGGSGFGSSNGTSSLSGAEITDVFSGSPAAGAGLSTGDTITSFAGVNVEQASAENEISDILLAKKPGDTIQVAYVDTNGNAHHTNVTLSSGPPQ
jgi:S1-C subfamily serine protease